MLIHKLRQLEPKVVVCLDVNDVAGGANIQVLQSPPASKKLNPGYHRVPVHPHFHGFHGIAFNPVQPIVTSA